MNRIRNLSILLIFIFVLSCSSDSHISNIPSPENYYGFTIGEDKKLVHPSELIEYFKELGSLSNRMIFKEAGRTTDDNPFIMAIISSSDNIRNVEEYKEINAKLADPRLLTDSQAEELISEGKAVVAVNMSIHATEVGPAQASSLILYKLLTDNSPEIKQILDKVIFIMTPFHNPDGAFMVTDWWNKYVNTEYEGSRLPFLYHRYTGHDNNRDWYFFTQKETQLTIKHIYDEWHPQIVVDMHQMGSTGARLFVPPFTDPYEPNIDPILQTNVNMLGTYMMNRLTAKGLRGVESFSRYDAWTPGRAFQHYHGAVRILTETASCNIAAPVNISRDDLEERNKLQRSVFLPLPWEGGEWALSDVVKYNYEAVFTVLENAALTRETWLSNFYRVGKNAVSKKTDPFAVVIPAGQPDPYSAKWMLNVLKTGLVEIHKAEDTFIAGGKQFEKGSAVIYMNQPYYSFAKTLLEKQVYPEFREYAGGPIKRPYDLVANTLPLFMGIDVEWIKDSFEAHTTLMQEVTFNESVNPPEDSPNGYIVSHTNNGMYIASNRLLNEGYSIYWVSEQFVDGDRAYPPGTIIIKADNGQYDRLKEIAEELNINLITRYSSGSLKGLKLNPAKVGLYKSFFGNMNEGWTRWVFEKFEFDMESIGNETIKAGNLEDRFNTIVLASDSEKQLVEGRTDNIPPEYKGGLSGLGIDNLKDFVRNGGTLLAYGSSTGFVLKNLNINIINSLDILSDSRSGEISIPGSVLRTVNNTNNPISYGLPKEGSLFYRYGSAFIVRQGKTVSRYPNTEDLLLSGWLEGAKHIKNRSNVVEVPYGRGRVILIGFDPIYRAQVHSSFKYIFNSIFYSNAENTVIPGS